MLNEKKTSRLSKQNKLNSPLLPLEQKSLQTHSVFFKPTKHFKKVTNGAKSDRCQNETRARRAGRSRENKKEYWLVLIL